MAGKVTAQTFGAERFGRVQASNRSLRASTRIGGKNIDVETYSPAKSARLLEDLTLVRKHFGLTASEALRISLQLVATSIREGKFSVG